MQELQEYLLKHTEKGACTCGKCCDSSENPKAEQPESHTVDLTFFKVAAIAEPDADTFEKLVRDNIPECFDGKEHNYIELGAKIGDQGLAFLLIGLGHLLKLWKALTPDTVMPFLPNELKKKMAGQGMVALQYKTQE